MDVESTKTKITEITKTILDKMGFKGEVEFSQENTEKPVAVLSVVSPDDSGFLIGKNGNNLEALEHVIRAISSRIEAPLRTNFMLDINDYRKTKARYLTRAAKEAAERVVLTARAEALDPMTSYERRLVHMELASHSKIATESIGEEPKRRIVIKPLM